MLYLDYLAYNNAIKHISIGEKLLLGGGGLVLAMALPRPAVFIAVTVLMHGVMLYARIPPGYILRLWLMPLAFLAAGLAGVVVSVAVAPFDAVAAFEAGPYYVGVTATGLSAAGTLLMRSLAAVSCLFMLATTTPAAYLAGYLSRFPALRDVCEVALLAYRFIFVFLAAAGQIYTAQQSRLGYADSRRSLRSIAFLAGNVGQKAFLMARDINNSLMARNYGSRLGGRYPPQPMHPLRTAAIIAVLAAIAFAACRQ